MPGSELPITFDCAGQPSVGILHQPEVPADVGVVIVVGGPQYRVGSHRQFVLLARALALAGVPVLRFDHRGVGDCADSVAVSFDKLDDDIDSAVNVLIARTGVERILLWGLCDGASAILMYAATDPRICGLFLLNPWVHTDAAEAQVRLKSYYLSRLKSKDFWRKLVRFDVDVSASLKSIFSYARSAIRTTPANDSDPREQLHFIERMRIGLERFAGDVYLVLSGNDLTADEFRSLLRQDPRWRAALRAKLTGQLDITAANHTFASRQWRGEIEQQTVRWAKSMLKDSR